MQANVFKGEVAIHDAKSGKLIRSFPNGYGCAAFNSDGKLMALPSKDWVKVLEVKAGKELSVLAGHEAMITRLAFGPGDKQLATASFDGSVKVWELATKKDLHTLKGPFKKGQSNWVLDLAWSKDGKQLAFAGHSEVAIVWDARKEMVVHQLTHPGNIFGVTFSSDGKSLATVGADKNKTTEISQWDLESGRKISTVASGTPGLRCVVFHPDGKRLVSADSDGRVQTWDRETGKKQHEFRARPKMALIQRLAFSADGKLFATANSDDRTVRIWDAAKLNEK